MNGVEVKILIMLMHANVVIMLNIKGKSLLSFNNNCH